MKILCLVACAATLLCGRRLCAQSTNGLIAWYPLNGSAVDASGNGNDGTIEGAVPAANRFGQSGQALSFNGFSSFVDVPDAAALRLAGTDFTVAAWIFETQRNTNFGDAIITKRTKTADDGWSFSVRGLRDPDNTGRLLWGRGGTDPFAVSSNTISIGQWHQVSIVYTVATGTVAFYIDGALDSTTNGMPSPSGTTTRDMHIGNDSAEAYDNAYVFHGSLDDVRLYDRALSAGEVLALSNSGLFLNPPSLAGGNWTTTVGGAVSNQVVILQASTNLINWSSIATNTANPSLLYSIPIDPAVRAMFFRLKQ